VDIDLFSPELVEHMVEKGGTLNEKVLVAGEKTIFKNELPSGTGFQQEFPEVAKFSARWQKILGRDVDIKLKADLTPVPQISKPQSGAIEMLRKENP
jgi:hypothetical protein